MGATAAIVGAGAVVAGANYVGQQSAARKAEHAANTAAAAKIEGQEAALKEFEPWREFEDKARTSMGDILGYNGADAATAAYEALTKSPAFQMRLKTGQQSIDRSAAAGGGLFSGRTGMALTKYGQDLGSEEFGNEYARRAGMWDWAYGNTGNRATIYTGLGDIKAQRAYDVGQAGAQNSMAFPNAVNSAFQTMVPFASLYGKSGPFGGVTRGSYSRTYNA